MEKRENTLLGRTVLSEKLSQEEFNRWLQEGTDVLTVENSKLIVNLLKVPETPDFDFLYLQPDYSGRKNSRRTNYSFCGIFNRLDHSLYCASKSLSSFVRDWKTDLSRSDAALLGEFISAVNRRVETLVADNRENLSVRELTDVRRIKDYDYYRASGVKQDAIRRLFDDTSKDIPFVSHYQANELSDQILLDYLADRDGSVDRTARKYIADHVEQILEDLMKNELLQTAYGELLADVSNPLHRTKAISDAVKQSGAKTVTVTVQTDGQELTFKAAADSLIGYREYYNSFEIAAADRKEFTRLFGKYKDYCAEDIQRITYGRKTI